VLSVYILAPHDDGLVVAFLVEAFEGFLGFPDMPFFCDSCVALTVKFHKENQSKTNGYIVYCFCFLLE
jgi:hypothetical protein